MTPPWLPRLRPGLARFRGSGVVVAVSGGGDSVGLLRVLDQLKGEFDLRLSVAHLDHGTRGEEGRGDARFVAELAGSLGLPFDLGHWRSTRDGHFEADARRARYEWLTRIATARGCRVVAVGQTLDDQAETILHRILRGTGLRGLAGMPGRRRLADGVSLVRPLLEVGRAEVRDYLASIGQAFREDSTNLDTSRTRARIRLELLPELAGSYNPKVAEALVRLGKIGRESARAMERVSSDRLARIAVEIGPGRVVLDREGLAKLGGVERVEVLRLAWRKAGWPERSMDDRRWRRLAGRDWSRISVGDGVEAEASAAYLTLVRSSGIEQDTRLDPIPLAVPGWVNWAGGRIGATFEGDGPCDEKVDLDRLDLPLTVRQAEPGDRFGPLGLEAGSQPLNDFFRSRRVARADRGSVPIVSDRAGIIWVVGHRIGHRVRLTGQTTRTLGLRFTPDSPDGPEKVC